MEKKKKNKGLLCYSKQVRSQATHTTFLHKTPPDR